MTFEAVLWDLDDDPEGNVIHCAVHGVSKAEVEEVFGNPIDVDVSRSTGRPVVFGTTRAGRILLEVFEWVDATTVYPITAYEVSRRKER